MKQKHFASVTVYRFDRDIKQEAYFYFETQNGVKTQGMTLDDAASSLGESLRKVMEHMQRSESVEIVLLAREGGRE